MSLDTMIPKIWSARLRAHLDDALVYGNAISRDYQPDAAYGNAIEIGKLSNPSIIDYVKNTNMGDPEDFVDTPVTLNIDQQKAFNIYVDSIDEAQTRPNVMNEAMARAGYQMAAVTDEYIAELYAGFNNEIGAVGTPVTPDETDIYSYFTQAARLLDEKSAPVYGRYAIINPAGIEMLKNSGILLSDTVTGDTVRYMGQFRDTGMLPMGWKGHVAGFDLFMSNATPESGTSTSIWTFGHQMAIQMVDSVREVVGYSPEKRFGDAVKGLYVYGALVTQPDAGVAMYTTL